jgi:hypothetical protein
MPKPEKVILVTSSVESGTLETLPVVPEMELLPHELLIENGRYFDVADKICITSEYSLSSVVGRLDTERRKAVEALKDKARFREILKDIYPEYGFSTVKLEEIRNVRVSRKSVIKPVRGIFGTAVRVVEQDTDFHQVSKELEEEIRKNAKVYPGSVLSAEDFIVEDFIEGEEYAVDMFYDSNGEPKIVNIMHHPLPVNNAYIHMMYNSSKAAFDKVYDKAHLFFTQLNKTLKVKNFLMHSELKIHNGKIYPVEINSMRFGGMGLCNLIYYSHGINPFLCFLEDLEPDRNKLWNGKEDAVFSFFIAYNGKNIDTGNYRPRPDKLETNFTKVLHEHLFDYRKQLAFGIYFLEEKEENIREMVKLEFDDFFEKC